MAYIDFLSAVHKAPAAIIWRESTTLNTQKPRPPNWLNNGFRLLDGDRRICYGGYRYMPGRWAPVAQALIDHYKLKAETRSWILAAERFPAL